MLARFLRYKDIVWFRALAGLKAETRQNYLGYLWFLLEPALNSLTLYLIFGVLQKRQGLDYITLLLIGTTAWQWFDSGINSSLPSIKAKIGVLNCYNLPKYIFPVVQIIVTTIKFLFAFGIVLVFCSFAHHPPTWMWAWLPLIFAAQLLVVVGLALPLTLLATRVNDATLVIAAVLRILFFISGVFFAAQSVPENLRPAFYANPIASLMESYRLVIIYDAPPNLLHLGWAAALGACACMIGLWLCIRVDKSILKSIAV